MHSLDLLEPLEPRSLTHREHALVNHLHDGGIRAQFLEVTARRVPTLRGPGQENLLVRHDDGDERRHERVPVDEALRDKPASRVDVLDLLGRDVLALRQLEDVLLAVDDLEPAAGEPQADVARVQPPLVIDDLVRLVLRLVVALEHARAAHANLAAGVRPVRGGVVHLGHVLELDLAARYGRSDVSAAEVVLVGLADDARRLRHAVSLEDGAAEAHPQKLHHLRGDGRAARGHVPDATAEFIPEFGKDNLLPDGGRGPALLQRLLLRGVRDGEHLLLHEPALPDARVNLVVDAVPQPGHRAKHRGLQLRDVVQQTEHVAAEETRLGPREEAHQHGDALVDVREGQVGHVAVAGLEVEVVGVGSRVGDEVAMGQHHALGVARGAARVAYGRHRLLPRWYGCYGSPPPLRLQLFDRDNLARVCRARRRRRQWLTPVRVHDQEFHRGALREAPEHGGQARVGHAHRRELCVVADEPNRVGPEGVVERHGDQRGSRHRRVQHAPLRGVHRVHAHVVAGL